jgi:hypothetical protein
VELLKKVRPAWALGLAMIVCAAGCVWLSGLVGEVELAFSHSIHVVDQELSCVNCHENVEMEDDPGMPTPDMCELCHIEIDAEKEPERAVETLFDEEVFRAAHVARLDGEVVFSHLQHTRAIEDCGACHTGIETNERVGAALTVDMATCTDCHAEQGVASECATCHTHLSLDTPPASHRHNWSARHGKVVRAHSEMTMDNCSMCHQESTCAECHMQEPPPNHSNTWRRQTHGIAAAMDRENCSTCHLPDACDRCHAETQPRSHVGSFGAPRSRHCLTCHFPLKNESCMVCHKDTQSHALAAPKPAWHTPAMNCRQCHGISQPLPHVDKGDNCNLCHL